MEKNFTRSSKLDEDVGRPPKTPPINNVANMFLQSEVPHEEIVSAGNNFFAAMEGGGVTSTLHTLRYEIVVRSAANAIIHLAKRQQLNVHIGQITRYRSGYE
ncbi:hypothetical protein EVAR_41542_1 [Eumeta japonica]|uniref:Uncharacterized protein n=1 Tax=Eumeta variegata TaxID=151549 RepID=A0A4C1X4H5_EUMVA|nr:hypothetical protein EVAR_41542_1 [Eumeta japonica]